MLIEEVVQQVLNVSLHHLLNLMNLTGEDKVDMCRGGKVAMALHDYLFENNFLVRCEIIADPGQEAIEVWGRIVAHFLYVRWGLVTDDSDVPQMVDAYQRVIPQLYTDLFVEGEILEAKLATV